MPDPQPQKTPPEETNKKDSETKPPYGLDEFLYDINLGGLEGNGKSGGQGIKGSTSLYSSTDGLRANRAGYVTLGAVNYQTHAPDCIFYLPLPENFYIPLDLSWSEKSEDGFFAEMISRIGAGGGLKEGTFGDAAASGARWGLTKLRGMGGEIGQAADAALRAKGLAYNPNNQLYFEGVPLANGQWTFNLVPKNQKEAYIMYASAKYMMHRAAPGSSGSGAKDLLKQIIEAIAVNPFQTQENPEGDIAKAKREYEHNEEALKKLLEAKSSNYIPNVQPAFFQYPSLWDFTVYYPLPDGDSKKVFEWKRLAMTSFRINFGSEPKWHADALPLSISLEIGVQETIVRTRSSMQLTMPTVIF